MSSARAAPPTAPPAAATRLAASRHRRGVLLMVGATLCWASAGMLVRNMDLRDSWEINFWRSLFMTLFIVAVLSLQYRARTFERLRAVGVPGVVAGALWALMYLCFILALGYTSVANVLVLSSIAPFSTALLGRLILGERVPARTGLAMGAAFAGIVLMFMDSLSPPGCAGETGCSAGDALLGNLIALVIPFAFAVNVGILRRTHARVDMIPTLVLSGVFSMATALPFAWPLEPSAKDIGLLAIMGVIQLGLGVLLMILAAPYLKAAEIGLLSVLEILFGTFSTWLVVGERPGAGALTGGAVVIAALVVNELFGLRQRARPDEDEAVREVTGAGH